jgi:hypothetical protein
VLEKEGEHIANINGNHVYMFDQHKIYAALLLLLLICSLVCDNNTLIQPAIIESCTYDIFLYVHMSLECNMCIHCDFFFTKREILHHKFFNINNIPCADSQLQFAAIDKFLFDVYLYIFH